MDFVNPGFLYGLLAVSIPVIIHLFNFRRFKKVYFTNVAFIRELKQETQKQSRLKHLLVLLMRMLAIVALVLAFARPFIPARDNLIRPQETNNVSVYVDNSFSMQAESEKGTLLESAKEKADEIASVYKASDRFQLLTNDMEGRHQRFVSKDEFLSLVDEIGISPVSLTISQVMTRQEEIQKQETAEVKTAYIISDFQKNFVGEMEPPSDTLLTSFLIALQAFNYDNIYIDSCWFDAPVQQVNQQVKLNVRIKNSSENAYEKMPLRLSINETQKAVASFDLEAHGETIVLLSYTNHSAGIQSGELEINDHPIIFDDRFYFSYFVSAQTNILSINGNGENSYLNALFSNDSTFNFENTSAGMIDYSSLPNYNLILLNELPEISSGLADELKQFVESGGSLAIIPSASADLTSANTMLREMGAGKYASIDSSGQKITFLNLGHPIYSDVFDQIPENIDLPFVIKNFRIEVTSQMIQDKLLSMQNGDIFLNVHPFGLGKVYLFAVPFKVNFSTFPKHAIFVPTLYKIAVSSMVEENLYQVPGKNELIKIRQSKLSADQVLTIINREEEFEIIPEIRRVGNSLEIYPHGEIKTAGNYMLQSEGKQIKGISFNYDRLESEMAFYTNQEIEDYLADRNLTGVQLLSEGNKPFVQTLADLSQGIQLWKYFVLAALGFLLAEVILLRAWK